VLINKNNDKSENLVSCGFWMQAKKNHKKTMAREGTWDVEVQRTNGHSSIRLDEVHPADTTVGDLKQMILEREGFQPDTFQLWPGRPRRQPEREEQQQPDSPKARRLDDLCTLDHYASLLLLDEKKDADEQAGERGGQSSSLRLWATDSSRSAPVAALG
jgi:hypothetical protein